MSQLIYLLVAVALSIVGTVWLWYRYRKPPSLEQGIEEFAKELRALAPEQQGRPDRNGRGAGRSGRRTG